MRAPTKQETAESRSNDRTPVKYPEMPCHLARLKPGKAPIDGCDCRVCKFFRE